MDNHHFVFVGGLHRSGTSMLYRLLGTHHVISIFRDTEAVENEGQHLQDVYPPGPEFGGPGHFGFREAAHLTEQCSYTDIESKKRLWESWVCHWNVSCSVLAEKSPPNLIWSRYLQAVFPNSSLTLLKKGRPAGQNRLIC